MKKATFLLTLALAGCGGSKSDNTQNQNAQSAVYAYQLEENGCKTGSHSFSNLAEYCHGLRDDTLNLGCAEYTRREVYESRCLSFGPYETPKAAAQQKGPEAPKGYEAPKSYEVPKSAETPKVPGNAGSAEVVPTQVKFTGSFISKPTLNYLRDDGNIGGTLSGSIRLASLSPTLSHPLRFDLGFDKPVHIVGAETCTLRMANFSGMGTVGNKLDFTLISLEPAEINKTPCLLALTRLQNSGGTIEFTDLPTSQFIPSPAVKTTLLEIAPAQN